MVAEAVAHVRHLPADQRTLQPVAISARAPRKDAVHAESPPARGRRDGTRFAASPGTPAPSQAVLLDRLSQSRACFRALRVAVRAPTLDWPARSTGPAAMSGTG